MRVKQITTPLINTVSETATWGETVEVPLEGDLHGWGFIARYTVTDLGIEDGETFEGIVNHLNFRQNNNDYDEMQRDELSLIGNCYNKGLFTDLIPVIDVEQDVAYYFPFHKSRHKVTSWEIQFDMLAPDDEWGASSGFAGAIKPFVIYSNISEALKCKRVAAPASTSPTIKVPIQDGPVVSYLHTASTDNDTTMMKAVDAGGAVDVDTLEHRITSFLSALSAERDLPQASAVATVAIERITEPLTSYSGRIYLKPTIGTVLNVTKASTEVSVTFFILRTGIVTYMPGQKEEVVSRGAGAYTFAEKV